MKELTKAEEQVMQILWKVGKGFVKDILDEFEEPKPAYNTVSTIVRILETKGFIDHKVYGKTHLYFPLVARDEYRKSYVQSMLNGYFGSSLKQLVSFFSKEDEISIQELEEIRKMIDDKIESKTDAKK